MNLSEEETRLYAIAQERSRIDDTEGVARVLRQLVQLRPDVPMLSAMLANALDTLGQADEAEALFRKAVSLAPDSEPISLGLFHCLWDQGKQEAALGEMKRFTGLADSEEYRMLLAAINESLDEGDQ